MANETHESGWYPDPAGSGMHRYWNGSKWTGRYAYDRPRPGGRRRALVIGAIVVGVLAGPALVLSYALPRIDMTTLDVAARRTVLKPVPVPASACPYLRRVHDTAGSAGQAQWQVDSLTDFHAQLGPNLVAFESALRAALPRVPVKVATSLREVLVHVSVGVRQLDTSRSAAEYETASSGDVLAGLDALNDASDLVGNACGFRLTPVISLAPPTSAP